MRTTALALAVAASAVLPALCGCDGRSPDSATPTPSGGSKPAPVSVRYVTKVAPIEFTFPAGWRLNPEEHPFDLQCLSQFEDQNTGVFVFRKEDVALDTTPTDLFWTQVNDLKSKRQNIEEREALQRREFEDKTVTSITFLGDKDASRNSYTFSLIEFRADSGRFAVVLQVSQPGDWKASRPILETIIRSARLMPEKG